VALISTPLALPFAFLAHGVLSYIVAVATFFADIPFASVFVPTFTLPWVFILYALIGTALLWFSRNRDKSKSEVSDWTIEEEKEMPGRAASTLPGQSEPPIFFR
jgi:membrane protein implicated in regulation of membrane protease activity